MMTCLLDCAQLMTKGHVAVCRQDVLEEMPPFLGGGEMIEVRPGIGTLNEFAHLCRLVAWHHQSLEQEKRVKAFIGTLASLQTAPLNYAVFLTRGSSP